MKGYLFLFHGGVMNERDISPEAMQKHMQKWQTWVQQMCEQGVYQGGQPLLPGGKLVTHGGVVSDGPFPEAKEMVAGFMAIDVTTLDAAVEIAKDCPIYEYEGHVEVRQIVEDHGVEVPGAEGPGVS